MAKRFTDTEKFNDLWYRKLPPEYKCFWEFLLSRCDHAGFWKIDFESASWHIGAEIVEKNAQTLFEGRFEEKNGYWFIPKFIQFQYGELNPEVKLHQSVIKILTHQEVKGYQRVKEELGKGSLTPKDKDKNKDKVISFEKREKLFFKIPPTIEEVREYCETKGNCVNPQKFYSFYESKGWMVGKNKMKNWQAAINNWDESQQKGSYDNSIPESLRPYIKP